VFTPDRRISQRFKLRSLLSFSRVKLLAEGKQRTKAIDISTTGVCFATSLDVSVGEVLEVLLEIPRRVTGEKTIARKFTGRITYIVPIVPHDGASGHSRIGVQLLYYEAGPTIWQGATPAGECGSTHD